MEEFEEEVRKIIKMYKKGNREPLDGDEVDKLIEQIRNRINLIEGNITEREYEELEK